MSDEATERRSDEGRSVAPPHAGCGRRGRRPGFFLVPCAALVCLFTGCGPTHEEVRAHDGVRAYFAGDYREAVHILAPVAEKTDENFVLNNCRLGLAAMGEYDLDQAEAAFLRAYEVINSVGVNQGGRSIGAALVSEKIKVWKGEPYERAMANFYLGLTYYLRRDYNNARAAFENALFKLRDYGEGKDKNDQYRKVESDFALACIMLGRCWQHLGRDDMARQNFDRATQLHGFLRPVADFQLNVESNVLLIVDSGFGPRKYRDAGGAFVGFGPTPQQAGPIPPPSVIVDGRSYDLSNANRPTVDLLGLAQDRKWQDIDTIRAIKSVAAAGLVTAGAIDAANDHHGHHAGADIALIGAGLLLQASAQADVRQWETLPRTVFLLPLKLPVGRHDITVRFTQIPGLSLTWRDLVVPDDGEASYYFHLQQRGLPPMRWPPDAIAGRREGDNGGARRDQPVNDGSR
jgi:tetratricopeptide (TPR) repeat protein